MRRYIKSRGGRRQKDFENAIGSPAGVEMNGMPSDADTQLDNLVSGRSQNSSQENNAVVSRVVSPPPTLLVAFPESSHESDIIFQSSSLSSPGSNFGVQEHLDRVTSQADTDIPNTPDRMKDMINERYKTPQDDFSLKQQQAPVSTGSSIGPTVQFNAINFSPDFSMLGKEQQTSDVISERSSDAGSFQEAFSEQVDALNDLLTTPHRVLGDLANTPISPDNQDDDLNQEIKELEDSTLMLNKELSQIDWSMFGKEEDSVRKDSPSKQLFADTPGARSKGQGSSASPAVSGYTRLFSPSPGSVDQSKQNSIAARVSNATTPSPVKSPQEELLTDDKSTPESSSRKRRDSSGSSSFVLPKIFGFRKTPMKKNQMEISRNAIAKEDASDLSSAISSSPSASTPGGKNQSLANFSSIYGNSFRSSKGGESSMSESLVGEELLDADSTPSKQLNASLQTVGPIRKEQNKKLITATKNKRSTAKPSSRRGHTSIGDYDANVVPNQQPSIYRQQQQHILPIIPDRHNNNPNVQPSPMRSYHKLPSTMGMVSPIVYVDDTEDEEEQSFYIRVNQQIPAMDYSLCTHSTLDREVREFEEKEPIEDQISSRQIACYCGIGVVVMICAICALLIALFATALLNDMNGSETVAETTPNVPSGTIIIDVPSFSPGLDENIVINVPSLSSRPSSAPARLPTTNEPTPAVFVEDLEIEYNIQIANGAADDIPSSDYTPDLIDSMDRLSVGVLEALEEGKDPSSIYEQRRQLASIVLPTLIVRVDKEECPGATNDRDRCERIIASLSLSDSSNNDFQSTLQSEVDSGGLQYFLNQVNPNSPVSVLDSTQVPGGGTTAPSLATLMPSTAPSVEPTKSETGSPTVLRTVQPSTRETAPPTLKFTSQPSPFPTSKATPLSTNKYTPLPSVRLTPSPTVKLPTLIPTNPVVKTLDPTRSLTTENPALFEFLQEKSFDGGAALRDSSSAQHNAFMWLLTNKDFDKYNEQRLLQRFVMAVFYFSTDGRVWLNNEKWLTDADECNWFSKAWQRSCSGDKLENLELDYNNLNGFLPDELGLLSDSLQRIVLHGGPTESMDGSIPITIGYLTKLRVLYMPNNSMEGSLPSEIGKLTKLQQINLSNTRLQGSMPSEIGLLTNLITFDVSDNSFNGQVPTEIGMMEKVIKIHLNTNKFNGPIPSEIGQLKRLQKFNGYVNSFDSIPSELGQLSRCDTIRLQENNIQGPVPTDLGELRRLRVLDLGNNLLTGNIPTEFGKLVELKSKLGLASNQLRGSIPTQLGKLHELRTLDLRRNKLSGNIPEDLSEMKKITTIHLNNNDLEGTVPEKVCSLYGRTLPEFSTDCTELDDGCPCCTTCCVGHQCICRYASTPQAYLCYSRSGIP